MQGAAAQTTLQPTENLHSYRFEADWFSVVWTVNHLDDSVLLKVPIIGLPR